jgi:hypothetical protein
MELGLRTAVARMSMLRPDTCVAPHLPDEHGHGVHIAFKCGQVRRVVVFAKIDALRSLIRSRPAAAGRRVQTRYMGSDSDADVRESRVRDAVNEDVRLPYRLLSECYAGSRRNARL